MQSEPDSPLPFSTGTFSDSQTISRMLNLDKNPWVGESWPFDINYLSVNNDHLGGIQMVLLADGVSATYQTCRSQSYSRTQIKWTELKAGSELCLRVKDPKNSNKTRVGQITIGSLTVSSDRFSAGSFTGQVWEPTR
ncbi:hypothetical protein ACWZHB_02775 [Nocardia sp. FBN12]|uniref:hypothetical protein n=1 Tax=Nocardia sp. FBN12 TaxID=3419766 RepID=UPI003D04AE58